MADLQNATAPDDEGQRLNQGRLWSAPELRISDQHTRAADVFAYGTFLYELISRKDPSIPPTSSEPSQPAPALNKLVRAISLLTTALGCQLYFQFMYLSMLTLSADAVNFTNVVWKVDGASVSRRIWVF